MKRKIESWEPRNFKLETTNVWDFPDHGNWATHDSAYRGNWSPYVPRNLILRYSKPGEWILDQFCGSGTTLVEAKLLGRNALGIDINRKAIQISNEKCNFDGDGFGKVFLRPGDARNLDFIPDDAIDFICTHPPYADIIHYSADNPRDLSLLPVDEFMDQMEDVADECFRILKPGRYCAVMMGDIRQSGHMIPLCSCVLDTFYDSGFFLKEIIVKIQHNCQSTAKWVQKSEELNFLLMAHEHIFVFAK